MFCHKPTKRQIICMMTANNILIKEFSKLNIRFPQSPQEHYFSAPEIIFIQTLTFKKNKPVQKRNKAQHQAAMAKVASGQRQLSFLRLNANAVKQKAGTSSSSRPAQYRQMSYSRTVCKSFPTVKKTIPEKKDN